MSLSHSEEKVESTEVAFEINDEVTSSDVVYCVRSRLGFGNLEAVY